VGKSIDNISSLSRTNLDSASSLSRTNLDVTSSRDDLNSGRSTPLGGGSKIPVWSGSKDKLTSWNEEKQKKFQKWRALSDLEVKEKKTKEKFLINLDYETFQKYFCLFVSIRSIYLRYTSE
jgi:hypothetical protein